MYGLGLQGLEDWLVGGAACENVIEELYIVRNEHNPFATERGLYVDTSCADFVEHSRQVFTTKRYEHETHSRKLLNFPGHDTVTRMEGKGCTEYGNVFE